MPVVNHTSRDVQFKVVYCGPGMGGKTSNLLYIHSRLGAERRGDLCSLATRTDRTIFFDFLPVNGDGRLVIRVRKPKADTQNGGAE